MQYDRLYIGGIDPGPERSGYTVVRLNKNNICLSGAEMGRFDVRDNKYILDNFIRSIYLDILVVEGIASYGHIIGNTIINTAYTIGQFKDRWITGNKKPEHFGIFLVPEIRACLLGSAKGFSAADLRSKVKEMWAPILPDELKKDKNRHVINALGVITCYIVKNIGKEFFEI